MKFTVYGFTILMAVLLIAQYSLGRRLAVTSYHDSLWMHHHRRIADLVGIVMMVMVGAILAMIVINPAHETATPLRFLHLGFALSFVALWVLIRFKFTGENFTRTHQRLVYPYFACGIGMIATGVIRLYYFPTV